MRERKGWSQQRLAEASGLKQPNVARLEAGAHPPTLWTAWVVAEALGVPLADLVAEK
ncbi:MAG: XRE family transcriptional regulator [Rhizobium sp.]|nr:MAG: XRE family transcriptional regulator [Rhizobium sp.]